jgi:hypothetical protein
MVTEYDILENWEGPTTENKDWRKKLDKGIEEDIEQALQDQVEGMIEPPLSETSVPLEAEQGWRLGDPLWKEMLWGKGTEDWGVLGDIGRDLTAQGIDIGQFLTYLNPTTVLSDDLRDEMESWKFEGDLYDKIYDTSEYKGVREMKKQAFEDKQQMKSALKDGYVTDENGNKRKLNMSDRSFINDQISKIDEWTAGEPDDLIAEMQADENIMWGPDWMHPSRWGQTWKGLANEMGLTPSNVAPNNPYKDQSEWLRAGGNIIPWLVGAGSKKAAVTGTGKALTTLGHKFGDATKTGITRLVDKLPTPVRTSVEQLLPKLSGKGTIFPAKTGPHFWNRPWTPFRKDFYKPTTYRNAALSGIMLAGKKNLYNPAEAATISDSWDRDPVVFDSYMQDKLNNYSPPKPKPKPKPKGPGHWNEFEG